jgi:hypothetical protein
MWAGGLASGGLVRSDQLGREYSFKAPLLILIVKHDHGHDPQRVLARAAGGHLTLQVLQEAVSEVVLRAGATSGLGAPLAAVWAEELYHVFLRVAVERGPAGVAHSHRFLIMSVHRRPSLRQPEENLSVIVDAGGRPGDAGDGSENLVALE